MPGEKDLSILLRTMQPVLNAGDYVFCTAHDITAVDPKEVLLLFREEEGITIIIRKETADVLDLDYTFVASWITLKVHSSLAAVGLTAAFSAALAKENISCNVVAAYYHDPLFVDKKDAEKAMNVLKMMSAS